MNYTNTDGRKSELSVTKPTETLHFMCFYYNRKCYASPEQVPW